MLRSPTMIMLFPLLVKFLSTVSIFSMDILMLLLGVLYVQIVIVFNYISSIILASKCFS
jgi:hypothetical protein